MSIADSVLLIASGSSDEQLRVERALARTGIRHPTLAAVVRCPISRDEIQRTDHNTLRVREDNGAGICDALDLLDSYCLGGMPAPWTKHVTVSRRTRRAPPAPNP